MSAAPTIAHAPQSAAPNFAPLWLKNESGSETLVIDQPSAVLGRHSETDVRLLAPDVSRRHCRLFFDDGVWKVQDLSSLNGVFVNDDPVRIATLYRGDTLRLGVTAYVVEHGVARTGKGPRMKNETLRSIAKLLS